MPRRSERARQAGARSAAALADRGGEIERLADEELMGVEGEASARAFEVIYDRHAGAAYSLAYRILGARAAAEDAVQEAFLTVWRSRARYLPERGSVRTWILAIAHRRAIDVLRRSVVHDRRRAHVEDLEEREEAPQRTEAEVVRREETREVRAALDGLPAPQRKVLELAYFGGFTHREIATMLEEPLGTIKGRMRLGLEKLRDALPGDASS